MKTAAKMLYMLYVLCALGLAQTSKLPADPTPAEVTKPAKLTEPAPIPVPEANQKALYKAIHAHDQAQTQISTINSQFLQVQANAKQQMDQAQAKEKESAAAIAKAEDEAYKAASVDKSKFTLDEEAMQFTPRAKAAPAPPPAPHQ
jgi:hypothetical protein